MSQKPILNLINTRESELNEKMIKQITSNKANLFKNI